MSQKVYLRLNQDGSLEHVFEETSPRGINEVIIKEFGSKIPRVCRNVFTVDKMPCTMSISPAETYCYVMLRGLNIRCAYKADSAKILRPYFEGGSEISTDNPEFEGYWVPPGNMRLVFAARIYNPDTVAPSTKPKEACYLLSIDQQNRCWRLPLPNLYDLGHLCMGEFQGVGGSVQEAFMLAYGQFRNARWNADLITDNKKLGMNELFKFTLTNSELSSVKFAPGFDWQQYCAKAVTPITNALVETLPK